MPQNNCGFNDANGVAARELLVKLGPTLKVAIGFDEAYDPKKPGILPALPVEGIWALIDNRRFGFMHRRHTRNAPSTTYH